MTDEEVRFVLACPSIVHKPDAVRMTEKFQGVFTSTPLKNGDVLVNLTQHGCALQVKLERG